MRFSRRVPELRENALGRLLGQLSASGAPIAADVGSEGALLVKIRLDDEDQLASLPVGAAGAVTIYTDVGKPFHVISKVYIRMQCWQYYLPF